MRAELEKTHEEQLEAIAKKAKQGIDNMYTAVHETLELDDDQERWWFKLRKSEMRKLKEP